MRLSKHIKAYVVMPWIRYNIGKRIAGSKAFFHAVSKLCTTFTFVPEKSPSSQPKILRPGDKSAQNNNRGCCWLSPTNGFFLCCDRTFISHDQIHEAKSSLSPDKSEDFFSVVGTVVGRIIGLSGTMSICLDEKFRPDILIPRISAS